MRVIRYREPYTERKYFFCKISRLKIYKNNKGTRMDIKEKARVETVIIILRKIIPKKDFNIRTIKRILSEVIDYFENCSLENRDE